MTVDQAQTLPLHLRFSNLHNLQKARPAKSIDEVPPSMSSTLKSTRSIFDAVQPDAVFIQDMTQGVADTSWERQEASAWVSDEEDCDYIEAHLQTARHLSWKKPSPVIGNSSLPGSIHSPSSTNLSMNLSSPPSSDNSRGLVPIQSMTPGVDYPVKSPSHELCELLKSAELEFWIDKFAEQDIDVDCIADLSDNDLIGLGMSKIGTRRKFQRIVRQWIQQKSEQCS